MFSIHQWVRTCLAIPAPALVRLVMPWTICLLIRCPSGAYTSRRSRNTVAAPGKSTPVAGACGGQQRLRQLGDPVSGLPEVAGSAQQRHRQHGQHRREPVPHAPGLPWIGDLPEQCRQRCDPPGVHLPAMIGDGVERGVGD